IVWSFSFLLLRKLFALLARTHFIYSQTATHLAKDISKNKASSSKKGPNLCGFNQIVNYNFFKTRKIILYDENKVGSSNFIKHVIQITLRFRDNYSRFQHS